MATTTIKNGVADTPAGGGVVEYLGLQGPLAALMQGVSVVPHGDPWQIKGSLSHTPVILTDTLPAQPMMAWRVPAGKALLFTGGVVHNLTASIEYYRVVRRYFLFGHQVSAAPSAPAAPTSALLALTAGIGTSGAYSWKVAPVDCFGNEGALSAASTPDITLTSTNRGATITGPALGTGVCHYNVYRTLTGGSTYYFVGKTLGVGALLDALPDASIDQTLTPGVTWATGDIAGETADGPCEVIIEGGAVAPGTPPTHLVYVDPYGYQRVLAVTWPTTIGQRIRAKLYGETSNFIAVPALAASVNTWHGPWTDVRDRLPFDYGAVSVKGANAAPASGSYIVWGEQVIGVGKHTGGVVAVQLQSQDIYPTNPHGVLIPPNGEIMVEVLPISAGVAGVRDVTLSGMLIPTTGT